MALDAEELIAEPLENVAVISPNAAMPADRKLSCTDAGTAPRNSGAAPDGHAKASGNVFTETVMQQGVHYSLFSDLTMANRAQERQRRRSFTWKASCATLRTLTSRDTRRCRRL